MQQQHQQWRGQQALTYFLILVAFFVLFITTTHHRRMQGRGEFSFLIADTAKMEGVLNQHWHSGCIWAVFLASFVAPFGFRYVLGVEKKRLLAAGKGGGGTGSTSEVEMNEIKI